MTPKHPQSGKFIPVDQEVAAMADAQAAAEQRGHDRRSHHEAIAANGGIGDPGIVLDNSAASFEPDGNAA